VTLKKHGVVLDLVPPPTKVNNLIFGRTWIDSPGEMIMTNLTTGDKAVLYFQQCGWFGSVTFPVLIFVFLKKIYFYWFYTCSTLGFRFPPLSNLLLH
jgi:hypothetical protein